MDNVCGRVPADFQRKFKGNVLEVIDALPPLAIDTYVYKLIQLVRELHGDEIWSPSTPHTCDYIPIPNPSPRPPSASPTSHFSIFTCYLSSCTYCINMEIQVFNLFYA